MPVTPSGTGSEWNNSAPDVDQPLGLAYRALQHIMKGVENRIEQQHTAFGDSTAGGLHKPGKSSVLLVDTTANLDTYITDPSCAEWGIACATGVGKLFFMNDATTAWTEIMLTPQSLCKATDMTWTGIHQFDASVDFTVCKFTGDVTFTKGVEFDGSVDISGAFYHKGTAEFTGGTINADSSIVATKPCEFTSVVIDGSVDISQSLYCYSNVNIAGDFSGTGTSRDRLISAWATFNGTTGAIADSYNIANVDRSAQGVYCISFTTAMADANYAILFGTCISTSDAQRSANCFSAPVATGFRMMTVNDAAAETDVTKVYFAVIGG